MLARLANSFDDIEDSLIYRAIESCECVVSGNTVKLVAVRDSAAGRLLDYFSPKTILSITVGDRIVVRCGKYMYSCSIEDKCVDDGRVKLINVFNVIYRSIMAKLKSNNCTSLAESLFLFGIKNDTFYTLKVFHKEIIYIDNSDRVSISSRPVIDNLILHNPVCESDLLGCFAGAIIPEYVSGLVDDNILYLKNQNKMTAAEIEKYVNLRFADIVTDCEYSKLLTKPFALKSLMINGNQVIGADPLSGFLWYES
jgi:hypothetical protein